MTKTEESTTADVVRGWFTGRLPAEWFTAAPTVTADRDEILVVGELATPELTAEASAAEREAAAAGRIKAFREDTRRQRMAMAEEAQQRFRRTVSWGARCGERSESFTTLAAPVMTRLRQADRMVLDTLVDGGVARSRADALAWCVRLVGQHEADWIAALREALVGVEQARAGGPQPQR